MSISSKTSTLEEFCNSSTSSSLSYQTFSLVELINTDSNTSIEFPAFSVINDYYTDLKKLCVTIELNEEQYMKYKYKPKLLANYLYGNGELSFIILIVNEIMSAKDFDMKQLKLISKDNLKEALTLIRSAERKFIDSYNSFANE